MMEAGRAQAAGTRTLEATGDPLKAHLQEASV